MDSWLVNPTREDQLMEVPSKSRLFTLKHLPFKCLHMPHWETLQGEQKSKKAKFHQFRSSSCGSGQWLFCFFPSFFFFCVFFSCYYRVKAHSICFEFWFFVLFSFFLWVCNLSVLEALRDGMNTGRCLYVLFSHIQILFPLRFMVLNLQFCVFWWFLRAQCVVFHGERKGMRVNKRTRRRRVIRRALLCDMSFCRVLPWVQSSIIINSLISQRVQAVGLGCIPNPVDKDRHGHRSVVVLYLL